MEEKDFKELIELLLKEKYGCKEVAFEELEYGFHQVVVDGGPLKAYKAKAPYAYEKIFRENLVRYFLTNIEKFEGILNRHIAMWCFNNPSYTEGTMPYINDYFAYYVTADNCSLKPLKYNEWIKKAKPDEKIRYRVYQLEENDENMQILFVGSDRLKQKGIEIDLNRYLDIYDGEVSLGEISIEFPEIIEQKLDDDKMMLTICERLYHLLNLEHPIGYNGHSLSVSDIVVLEYNDKRSSFYCDSFGFTKIKEEKMEPKDSIRTYLEKCRVGALGSIVDPDGYTISTASELYEELIKKLT